MDDRKELRVEMGTHHVVMIDKLFGPLVACDVRVFIDSGDWVLERRHEADDGAGRWEEMARFDCQESLHFED